MAATEADHDEYLELVEEAITARNVEEYIATHPEEIVPSPPRPYSEAKAAAFAKFQELVLGIPDPS